MSFDSLRDLIVDRIAMRLRGLPQPVAAEIYAISLFTDAADTTSPEINFSVNTRSQVARALRGETKAFGGAASDEGEAKWNYAFWLQEPNSRFLVPPAGKDGKLWAQLTEERGIVYSDDDEFDVEHFEEAVVGLLVELAIAVSRTLHSSGVIREVFGHDIPVIVHELEYYDAIADRTRAANPPGAADEFIRWIADQ